MACCLFAGSLYLLVNSCVQGSKFDADSFNISGLSEPSFAHESAHSVSLEIGGMHCSSCSETVERELKKVIGVIGVHVLLVEERCIVAYDPVMLSSKEKLVTIVQDCGFTARLLSTERTESDDDLSPLSKSYYDLLLCGSVAFVVFALQRLSVSWPLALLSTYGHYRFGLSFFKSSAREISRGSMGMATQIAVSTTFAYLLSMVHFFQGDPGNVYFDTVLGLIFVIKGGKYFESVGKQRLRSNMTTLESLLPESALLLGEDGVTAPVPVEFLQAGDLVSVRPGSKFPVDGIITSGETAVDTLALTGESIPHQFGPGDAVLGGTLNLESSVTVKSSGSVKETQLTKLCSKMTENGQLNTAESPIVATVTRFFAPLVLCLAAITYLHWMGVEDAELRALSVLTVACPCALGLAVPAAITQGSNAASKLGCFVRRSSLLMLYELLKQDTVVILDKTGTLTTRELSVTEFKTFEDLQSDFWKVVATAEAHEIHPVGQSLYQYCGINEKYTCENMKIIPGKGINCTVVGEEKYTVVIGSGKMFGRSDMDVFVSINGKVLAGFNIGNSLRDDAYDIVKTLQAHGFQTWLVTGDTKDKAGPLSEKLGIERCISECTPLDKQLVVQQLHEKSKKVIMVGDGLNDGGAMSASDLSISLKSSHQMAIDNSDVVLMHDSLSSIGDLIGVSKRVNRAIKWGLGVSLAYNMVTIPWAMGLLEFGVLSPQMSGTLMTINSVIVIIMTVLQI